MGWDNLKALARQQVLLYECRQLEEVEVKALTKVGDLAKARKPEEALTEPRTKGERVVILSIYKDVAQTNIDIGYKPRGMKWKE
ncbi:hypothetical protein CQW23_07729 [Capsicum baccatum]|uniref:Uncharacterized protein n=1 Tax=Capsicum baccatum TaxID=33114 RepID=A0A2G2X713_CAPBA|nr:hypothetical protein CQW23_07729 [Capsicum baccatum]